MRLSNVPVRLTVADGKTLTIRNIAGSTIQVGDYDDLVAGSPENIITSGAHLDIVGPTSKWVNSTGSSDVDVTETNTPITATSDLSDNLKFSKALGSFSSSPQVIVVAPVMFPLQVMAVSLVSTTALSTSDTDYWTIEVGKIASLQSSFGSVVATKTTQTTGGAPFFNLQVWNFDAVTFNAGNAVFLKDDIIALRGTKTGAPVSLSSVDCVVRYRVLQ